MEMHTERLHKESVKKYAFHVLFLELIITILIDCKVQICGKGSNRIHFELEVNLSVFLRVKT